MDSKPVIWRRILVDSNTFLPDMHAIIQQVMGWQDHHLHQFIKDNIFYSEEEELVTENDKPSWEVTLGQLLHEEHDSLLYEYDFGDGWIHEIVLEKVIIENINYLFPFLYRRRECMSTRG